MTGVVKPHTKQSGGVHISITIYLCDHYISWKKLKALIQIRLNCERGGGGGAIVTSLM